MRPGLTLREDYDAARLRGVARRTKSAAQGRRLLALAEIYDGGSRDDPGLGAEVQRAWPRGARGPPSAGPSWQAEHRPTRGSGSDGRERSDACDPWGRTLADLAMWVWEEFRVSVSETTLSRILRALGYRKLSARPRHHAQAAGAATLLKSVPRAPGRDRARQGDRSRPDRGLVRGRGPDRAEEQDHPALGTTGNAALGAARSAHRFHLHLRGYLPRQWQGSRARPARLQHRGDEPAPRRNRRRSGSRQARRTRRRPGRMAPLGRPRGSRQHHARAAPAQMPGAQPRRERLAVHAR